MIDQIDIESPHPHLTLTPNLGRLHLNWVKTSKCFRIPLQVEVRHREVNEWWHVDGKSE